MTPVVVSASRAFSFAVHPGHASTSARDRLTKRGQISPIDSRFTVAGREATLETWSSRLLVFCRAPEYGGGSNQHFLVALVAAVIPLLWLIGSSPPPRQRIDSGNAGKWWKSTHDWRSEPGNRISQLWSRQASATTDNVGSREITAACTSATTPPMASCSQNRSTVQPDSRRARLVS